MSSTESLAVNGGSPVRTDPMPARRLFGKEEKAAAVRLFDEAISTGQVFGYNGPEETAFEEEFSAHMGGGLADGVNSGTTAVFAALGALKLEAGSEVIVPPITDPGGCMPVVMLNCVPVFADAHPQSYNMGPEQFEAAITANTRAAVVAHVAGEPVEMETIMAIADKHNILVLEDCAQAHGARLNGKLVGTFGAIAAFSTMSGKHFATAAQGGVVFTKDEELHWNGKRFADRGKPFNSEFSSNMFAGLNLNLNDLSAAVGRVQLKKLPGIIERRRKVGEGVRHGTAGLQAVSSGWQPDGAEASYWFIRITVDESRLTVDKATFVEALQAEGIPASASYSHIQCKAEWFLNRASNWCPWLFKDKVAETPVMPNAIAVIESNFTITCHESYTDRETDDIVAALQKVEQAYLA